MATYEVVPMVTSGELEAICTCKNGPCARTIAEALTVAWPSVVFIVRKVEG
jgi:hypothetical protein